MDRTNADGSIASLYVDRNLSIGRAGTLITARDKNLTQEEICNVIEFTGAALDENDDEQLRKAVQYLVRYPSTLPEYSANPTTSVQAARKAYVDAREAAITAAYTDAVKRVAGNVAANAFVAETSAADNDWSGVCWSPELALFCAVSYTGTGNRVMTSQDGVTWTSRVSAADNQWMAVCWSPELTLFCAVAQTGADRVMTSPDGINWTVRSCPSANWRSICWSPTRNLFVAVANGGGTDYVMTSPDGINWTGRTAQTGNWYSVCWSPELALFCAVSADGLIMTSSVGITWSLRVSPEAWAFTSVTWASGPGVLVAVSHQGVVISASGISWTAYTIPLERALFSVVYAAEIGLILAVAQTTYGADRYIMSSLDGQTWIPRRSPAANDWNGVTWAPALGIFAAVAASGTGNRVMRTEPVVI